MKPYIWKILEMEQVVKRDNSLGGHLEELTINNWMKNKWDYQNMEKEYPKGKIHKEQIECGILKVKDIGSKTKENH